MICKTVNGFHNSLALSCRVVSLQRWILIIRRSLEVNRPIDLGNTLHSMKVRSGALAWWEYRAIHLRNTLHSMKVRSGALAWWEYRAIHLGNTLHSMKVRSWALAWWEYTLSEKKVLQWFFKMAKSSTWNLLLFGPG